MALASLDGLTFRINPNSIKWNFQINTSVTNTLGGRVVQVLGATLSDIQVGGDFGQDNRKKGDDGLSWKLAEQFMSDLRDKALKQTTEVNVQGKSKRTLPTLDFRFPDYGWHFGVYIKGVSGGDSAAAISHSTGKFSYSYVISLFVVEDRSDTTITAGGSMTSNKGVIDKKKQEAIASYIARISAGVGWKKSEYNDPQAVRNAITGGLNDSSTTRNPNGDVVQQGRGGKQAL